MKNFISFIVLTAIFSCNMSDREYSLPLDYIFIREGGYENIIIRDHKLIVAQGAIDFSYDDNYVMFAIDTVYPMPAIISTKKLLFLVHDIKKYNSIDTLNYTDYKKFIIINKIEKENDLSIRKYFSH